MRKGGFPAAPLILTMILCPRFEQNVKRSLIKSGGDPFIFLEQPISAVLLLVAALLVLTPVVRWLWSKRLGPTEGV
jgi:putative tricarboxylic transport membrane protein